MCISDFSLFTVTKSQSHNNVKGPVISERDFSTAPPWAVTAAAGEGGGGGAFFRQISLTMEQVIIFSFMSKSMT